MKTVKIPETAQPWSCSINGVTYTYPAGTEQSVPDEVAAIIEGAAEFPPAPAPVDKPFSGGGGGGAGGMVVNVTPNEDETLSVDKSIAEIFEAAYAGICVVARLLVPGQLKIALPIVAIQENLVTFGMFWDSETETIRYILTGRTGSDGDVWEVAG